MDRWRVLPGVPAVALAAALAACAPADGANSPTTSAAAADHPATAPHDEPIPAADVVLTAGLVQYRRDAQRDVIQVKVTNDGQAPVEVRHVVLESATFESPVSADKASTVRPGTAVDLTVDLPAARCDGPDRTPVEVRLTVVADGLEQEVVLPTSRAGAGGTTGAFTEGTGADVLAEVQAGRCAAVALAEHVTVTPDPVWRDGGALADGTPTVVGRLVVEPVAGGRPVELVVEGATTLFTFVETGRASVAAGAAEPTELPLRVRVTRCDPHAVAEDKKGYLVPVRAAVDGAEPVLVEVAVPVPERAVLQELIDRSCR